MFDFIEEALYLVSLLVKVLIIIMWLTSVGSWRDDGFGPLFKDGLVEVICIIGGVSDDEVAGHTFDEVSPIKNLASLAGGCDEAGRMTMIVGCGMNFGCQAATGAAQTLGIRPPFSLRAPAAC